MACCNFASFSTPLSSALTYLSIPDNARICYRSHHNFFLMKDQCPGCSDRIRPPRKSQSSLVAHAGEEHNSDSGVYVSGNTREAPISLIDCMCQSSSS